MNDKTKFKASDLFDDVDGYYLDTTHTSTLYEDREGKIPAKIGGLVRRVNPIVGDQPMFYDPPMMLTKDGLKETLK